MKKIILTLFLLSIAQLTYASGVGYVDYEVMFKNIIASKDIQLKIDAKYDEIKAYNRETAAIARKQQTRDAKSEVILHRKPGLNKLEKEYYDLKNRQVAIVKTKTKEAADVVLKKRNLDIIIDKRYQVAGGVDCTKEILEEIR